ncbi:MAG: UDP-N-acetylmuramate dehydrogenase [Lachnospiraceae bacterium]|nr:UDP-N-acetylmuramate dehydrogenase [Lachnospiraceae bacterium]
MQTSNSGLYEYISSLVPTDDILTNEPMSAHTTFRVGGEASMLVRISSPDQLLKLIPYLNDIGEPYYVIGNGSNILVGDKGYNGVILEIGSGMSDIRVEGNRIIAGAGALLSSIARAALENDLSGLEFASGIPGSIGGGVVMNAGAYGGEIRDVVTEVEVMSVDGQLMTISNRDMQFGYRTSIIKMRPFTVLSVTMELTPGDHTAIEDKMKELSARRKEKQPLEYPSAGSTFKRPEGYFAGKLIMDAGMRGYTIGGAAVSEKHCGFIVNKGNATAADVYEVIQEVEERVKERFDVTLEPEIVFLGTF